MNTVALSQEMRRHLLVGISAVMYAVTATAAMQVDRELFTEVREAGHAREVSGSISPSRTARVVQVDIESIRRGDDLSVTLDDRKYSIEFASWDHVGMGRIWRGNVIGGGQAQISIVAGTVVGEIKTGRRSYLILPAARNHIIVTDPGDQESRKALMSHFDPQDELAVARHRQLIRLDSDTEHEVTRRRNEVHWLTDSLLGSIEDDRIRFNERGRDILMLTGSETFEIAEALGGPEGLKMYWVDEFIHGIRVADTLTLMVSVESNEIVGVINAVRTDRDIPSIEPADVDASEAERIAIEAIKLASQRTALDDVTLESKELVYRTTDEEDVRLVWEVRLTAPALGDREVFVDAKSREATIINWRRP